jgi:hypothetical protein
MASPFWGGFLLNANYNKIKYFVYLNYMSESLSNKVTFFPKGKPTSVVFFWLVPTILFVLMLIKFGDALKNIVAGIFLVGLLTPEILLYKKNISITVSTDDCVLECCYYNCWGQKRSVFIDLNATTISYKYWLLNLNYRLIGKIKLGWRIKLSNVGMFSNKVVIKQDEEIGYTKTQLDEIATLINQC